MTHGIKKYISWSKFLHATLLGVALATGIFPVYGEEAIYLPKDYREALERGCAVGSAIEKINCRTTAQVELAGRPALEIDENQRQRVSLKCLGDKQRGLIAYDDCFRRVLAAAPAAKSAAPASSEKDTNNNMVAMSPERIYENNATGVYLIRAFNAGDTHYKLGSAVAFEQHRLMTNCHIIEGKSIYQIKYLPDDDTSYKTVSLAASDFKTDRCIMQSAAIVKAISGMRKYRDLRIGEKVYAIGNPSGMQNTFSEGIISGLRSGGSNRSQMIQTTAPITQGSSGGGLFDSQGRLVGITTLAADRGNLNFAISVDDFMAVANAGQ